MSGGGDDDVKEERNIDTTRLLYANKEARRRAACRADTVGQGVSLLLALSVYGE